VAGVLDSGGGAADSVSGELASVMLMFDSFLEF
jgi:hypothetical protein